MSSTSILGVIQHYQRSIEHSQDDEGRLLHCINKLYRLPVKVEHLQETGVGKTVNSLRKFNGEIGVAAKALVTKWKAMVAAEEEPMETNTCQSNDDDDDDANNANGRESSDDDHCNQNNASNNNLAPAQTVSHSRHTTKSHQSTQREKDSSNKHSSKGKSHREEKSHKSSRGSSSSKQGDEETPSNKKYKNDERDSKHESKKHGSDRHSTPQPKSERQRERNEKQNSKVDTKATSSSQYKCTVDTKEKKDGEKVVTRDQQHSSSKQSNQVTEKASKHAEREKDKHERSKESKEDKTKSVGKEVLKRDSHQATATTHSSCNSSKPSSSTSSSSFVKADGSSGSNGSNKNRKRQQDCDSDDAISTIAKVAKTVKPIKQKMTANSGEDVVNADDGIDSSMGANFADVLGMLNMRTKKSKKSTSTNKSPTASTSSRSSARESSNDKGCSSSNSSSKNAKNEYTPSPVSSSFSPVKASATDAKPELLSASAKLEPLDPSIMLELPTISANYRPLPHNKIIMDCVYRNSSTPASVPKAPVRTLTDAEAISHGISSKTMRTKIYSGIKTGQMLQVPSLFDLCIRVLQKNIDALEYTGGVPFEVLRPVLERATPHQLLTFEEFNPYLMEDSDCLWQIHVQRSYRSKKRQEMESWREMFLRCEEEKERKLNSLTETIKQSQKIIAAPVRKTQLAFVDSMVKPPRNVMRKQEQYGTKAKLVATPASRVAALSSVTPNAAKVGDTRLRVAATVRDAAQVSHAPVRAKKAPLMVKTLQFMRGRHKR